MTSEDRPLGLVVVQIDGLSRPLLERLIAEGRMPVLGRLVRTGRLVLDSWVPQLPSCTPASQAGILHGRDDGIPGFRWYERSTRRLMVANRPKDAAELARRISDGHGLLADGGSSVGNLLTGDAPSSHLTLATIEGDPTGRDRSTRGGGYPLDPRMYVRIAGLMAAELGREVLAAVRREDGSDELRSTLRWRYLLARSVSTVPLRLLSTALVARAMRRGRPIVYVDFTGHDEVAHSRGPRSAEAKHAATSIDESIGLILRARRRSPRRYRLVVLSDHGQSWGQTFSERFGTPLEVFIASTMGPGTRYHGATLPTEYHDSRVRLAGHAWPPAIGRSAAAIAERTRTYAARTGESVDSRSEGSDGSDPSQSDLVVAASGSLALVTLPRLEARPRREEIEAAYPGLLDAIARHAGVGAVVVGTAQGPVALGPRGTRSLENGAVEGEDPLAPFGAEAASSLRRLASFDDAADIVLVGALDPDGGVVTFEELEGSHGGLGGWQVEPFIARPPDLPLDPPRPVGAPALYRQLLVWMRELGIREER